ncbi:hypothetical protein PIB30_010014 [Stylosanthes scabra]|uniref:Uncharacterized protein n=1 Tax=Stylosanthes scabra TaxID=79078 RepID=A0ABU6V7J8_9FABA|nr:hypothetical protein [Stylosanthes scabra]
MEMELIYKESMKPSSATPPHPKTYPLSFLDVSSSPEYMPVLYFYNTKQTEKQESKLALLKKSLSEALSAYYPIAGRLKGRLAIDCNDEGVPLLITKIKCNLSHFLNNPITPNLLPLFPDNLPWSAMNNPEHDPIMAIQINCFQCGGIAIAVCLSHKFGDISTLFNFVNHWAAITSHHQDQNKPLLSPPLLDSGVSVFPQGNLPVYREKPYYVLPKSVCKRFVFEASKIEALKAMAGPIHPTRFQAVAALIYKCAVSTLSPNSPLLTSISVNLRKRMDPPIPGNTLGNMVSSVIFMISQKDQLAGLVSKMKEGMIRGETEWKKLGGKYRDLDFIVDRLKRMAEAPPLEALKIPVMILTSWCRFSMYEADFGWGKPAWIASFTNALNTVVFMDARDGKGMEVMVSMEEEHMASPRTLPSASPRKEHFLSLILIVYFLSRLRSIGSLFDAQLNNEGADDNIPQFTPEKGVIPPNQSIQQMETALRELLERQTREAEIATEAMKRAEAMAAEQQALLEKAEKRDQELKEKLRNRLTYTDEDEGVGDSRSHTWKPSVVAGNPPAKENSKHPFSLAILSEELPKKFKYLMDMEPYDGSSDPKHHLDAFDNRMVLLNALDATKCKAFSVTFKKDSLTWFNSLAPGSIKSFSDLSGGFLKNFTT